MKLNLAKCSFGVSYRKPLGYLVIKRGIDANLNQIIAIIDMTFPQARRMCKGCASELSHWDASFPNPWIKAITFFQILKKEKKKYIE